MGLPVPADFVEQHPAAVGTLARRVQDASVLVVIVAVQVTWLTLLIYAAALLFS